MRLKDDKKNYFLHVNLVVFMLGEHLDSWTSGTFQVEIKMRVCDICLTLNVDALQTLVHRMSFDCD